MSCLIVGQTINPVRIDSEPGGGSIGIDFNPSSAVLFLKTDLQTITNRFYGSHDIWGPSGSRMKEQLSHIESVEGKVKLLQHYLLRQLEEDRSNKIVDYAVSKIIQTNGFATISQLSDDICYSRQHLTRLFSHRIGVSPKEFACIMRFQRFYSRFNANPTYNAPDDLYDHYYDQSHYIKEFQKYTGYTPGEFGKIRNDFGSLFYRHRDVPFLQ